MADGIAQNPETPVATEVGGRGTTSLAWWSSLPWQVICAIAIVALVAAAKIDIITGDYNVGFLYFVPVLVVAWLVGRRAGFAIAATSSIIRLIADFHGASHYHQPSVIYVNTATRFGFFIVCVTVLSALKDLSSRLSDLVDQRTRSLRRLASQLSEAEDAERRRLAYDIHDGFSQNLSVLKMSLAGTLSQTPEDVPARRRINDALSLVDDLIERSRTLTFDLHPAMLDHLGLVPTLRRYAAQFSQQANIEVTVSEDGQPRPLPGPIANYLFRSTKELFNNAAKHGLARQIVAAIHWGDHQVRIVVDDDGGGFDAKHAFAPAAGKGLGLAGMRERLLSFGGSIRLESAAGEGTRAVLEVPLADQELVK